MRAVAVLVLLCSAGVSAPWSASLSQSKRAAGEDEYKVSLDTTKGAIVIAVHRAWGPNGADRFHELVASRYLDDSRFFRVVKGQWAQFGINRDPKVSTAWRTRTIPDDPRG